MASYRVRQVSCQDFDHVVEELERAIAAEVESHETLVACLPAPVHPSAYIHEVPDTTDGDKAYDAVWQQPYGPSFLLVIEVD